MRIAVKLLMFVVLLAGSVVLTTTALAATTLSSEMMALTPPAPGPNTLVTISIVNSASVPPGGVLRWYVDEVERTDDVNKREITLTTGELGTVTEVRTEISTPGRGTEIARVTIDPVRVDLIIGTNSHVPSFYRGRALPSGSSDISVRALVFGDTSGPYSYVWYVNGQIHTETVGKNNDQISFKPLLDNAMLVEVEVFSRSGLLVAEDTLEIPITKPEIYFYEANPLRGLIPNVLPNPYYFVNEEITVRGEPYYFAGTSKTFDIEWRIDRQSMNANENPLELTLVKARDNGQAQLEMSIINTAGFLETAKRSMGITF